MEESSIPVLLADDEALVRQGTAALLKLEGAQVTEAADGEEAMALLRKSRYAVAFIDIGLPKRSGLDVLADVIQRNIPTKVIILTGDTARYSPKDIYAAGAAGFIYKTADADELIEQFHAVHNGSFNPDMLPQAGEDAQNVSQLLTLLTKRERQIVKLIVEGASNRIAANTLSISEHTVRKHREHINTKLQLGSPAALAAFAIRTGLI